MSLDVVRRNRFIKCHCRGDCKPLISIWFHKWGFERMTTQENKESGLSAFNGILNKVFWTAGTACVVLMGAVIAAQVYQDQKNGEERAKMSPLVAEFNGHSYMVTGRDTVSEVVVGVENKFENVVSYDFAHGLAIHGKTSPAPGAVLGFNQLPGEITSQVKQAVCQTTRKAVDDGIDVNQHARQFIGNYCLP